MYEMDRDLEKIVLNNPTESSIYDHVRSRGMLTMREDAIVKSLRHQIPFEEVGKL